MAITTINVTPEILTLVASIDEFKGRWAATKNPVAKSLREVAMIESVGASARSEGVRLTNPQVMLLLRFGEQKHATRDEQIVVAYANLIKTIVGSYQTMYLTEGRIKQLHGLLAGDRGGEYKKVDNQFEAVEADGKRFDIRTATALETPTLMAQQVDWYNESIYRHQHNPLVPTAMFIAAFLAIHPFDKGNGWLSRILDTLLLLRAGYDFILYSSRESFINNKVYGRSLRNTLPTIYTPAQNWEPWLTAFLKTMVKQKNWLGAKMDEQASLTALPSLSRQILRLAKERGEVNVKDIEGATRSNRNTIKLHVRNLVGQHYLTRVGNGRGARYTINPAVYI